MKDKGIVRRIDELGRIVVPKEIRKLLRIGVGTPIEITTTGDNEIVLRKFSTVSELGEITRAVIESFFSVTECNILICDTDKYIDGDQLHKKAYIGKTISKEIETYIKQSKPYILNVSEGAKTVPLIESDEVVYAGQIIIPLLQNGDVLGGVVVWSDSKKLDNATLKLVQFVAQYIRCILE